MLFSGIIKKWATFVLKIWSIPPLFGTGDLVTPVKRILKYPKSIQGLLSLNVGILPSCRGPQLKKNSVKIFLEYFGIF